MYLHFMFLIIFKPFLNPNKDLNHITLILIYFPFINIIFIYQFNIFFKNYY